ncbi:hypothetical protein WI99_16705 [Burkholderia cepacia]|uniref:hypothetical protein n=1 Tax=Burkholderia cepacia complex TaxID=87882 RepID=UPI00075A11E3|nr:MULTISPECIES: hypothetical protein [Burkholderia cepacia complex]KVE85510.1 hypothetical protein WI99_16705 [Burkholderia cepacia]
MNMKNMQAPSTSAAADFLLRDYMAVTPRDQVLITADTDTDRRAIDALVAACRVIGSRVSVATMPRLPYQGKLADPLIPDAVVSALTACDVWIDLTFPYLSGSDAHASVTRAGRARSVNILDLGADGLARLFSTVDFDELFAVQKGLDTLIADSEGKRCRIANHAGTDVEFVLAPAKKGKARHQDVPGTTAPMGSAVILPVPESVKGRIVVDAVFHEWYTPLRERLTIDVDGPISRLAGGGADHDVFDRALRRAGKGEWGSVIHFSHGFHPGARFTTRSFNEDIRVRGNDAVGFGTPWWEDGGGENHPDAVCVQHTFAIDGNEVVRDGRIVWPPELARAEAKLYDESR